MEQTTTPGNELQLRIGIAAAPAVLFHSGSGPAQAHAPQTVDDGFTINLEGLLKYESLSRMLDGLLAGRRFEVSEGLVATYVVVQHAAVSADTEGNLLVHVRFTGTFGGSVYFKGKPVYDAATKTMHIANMSYDLRSKSFLLQTAKWLLNNKINDELKKRTQFPLGLYFDTAKTALQTLLNKEWAKGISSEAMVSDLTLDEITALPGSINIRSHCSGSVVIKVSNFDLGKMG